MKLYKLILGIILCSLILPLSGAMKARADAGPPSAPKGGGITPGEETTMVKMISETVEIEVTGKIDIYTEAYWSEDREYKGYEALVNASFTMRNQGDTDEQMAVHFPLNLVWDFDDEYGTEALIQDFRVFVGGQELDWTSKWYKYSDLGWAVFDVTFPAHKNVNIRVRYTTYSPWWHWPYEPKFYYILETGAGWYGPIGEADIILKMPYKTSPENVIEYPPGAEFVGSEVHWHYENLEPTTEDNWKVVVLWPRAWQSYINAKNRLKRNPEDPNALVEYGWALFDLSTHSSERGRYIYPDRREKYEEAKQIFAKAESLKADSADFHAGMAYLLLIEYDHSLDSISDFDINSSSMQTVIEHMYTALYLDPNNNHARSVYSYLFWNLYESSYPTPGGPSATPSSSPTETLTSTITQTPTITLSPTSTLTPTRTPTITPTSKSSLLPKRTVTPSVVTRTPTRTSTPQPEIAGDNNAWLVGTLALVALIALIGGGFVWVWVEKGKA